MKLYTFYASGFALSSTIVVMAKSKKTAVAIAERALADAGLDPFIHGHTAEPKAIDTTKSQLLYFDNGDY